MVRGFAQDVRAFDILDALHPALQFLGKLFHEHGRQRQAHLQIADEVHDRGIDVAGLPSLGVEAGLAIEHGDELAVEQHHVAVAMARHFHNARAIRPLNR
jgi:hypothetical protein